MSFNLNKLRKRYPDVTVDEIKWVHAMHEVLDRGPLTENDLRQELNREYGTPWPTRLESKFKSQLLMELTGKDSLGKQIRKQRSIERDSGGLLVDLGVWAPKNRGVPRKSTSLPLSRRKLVAADENFSGELARDAKYVEGAATQVLVNRYERDSKARSACLEVFGCTCVVCQMNFGESYGDIGEGFIHVHHLQPMALRKGEYNLEPERDLAPVCPNCHAMLHTSDPPLEVDELRKIWQKRHRA